MWQATVVSISSAGVHPFVQLRLQAQYIGACRTSGTLYPAAPPLAITHLHPAQDALPAQRGEGQRVEELAGALQCAHKGAAQQAGGALEQANRQAQPAVLLPALRCGRKGQRPEVAGLVCSGTWGRALLAARVACHPRLPPAETPRNHNQHRQLQRTVIGSSRTPEAAEVKPYTSSTGARAPACGGRTSKGQSPVDGGWGGVGRPAFCKVWHRVMGIGGSQPGSPLHPASAQ